MDVALIAETFARAKTENGGLDQLGSRFYTRLFEKYPAVRPLFKTPPEEQKKKLMASLGVIVASVTQPEKLLPYLQAMAIRHVGYGTQNDHYPAVGENLVAVLGEHLAREGAWTQAMQANWEEALKTVSDVMTDAVDHPDQSAPALSAAGYLPNGFRANNSPPWELATAE